MKKRLREIMNSFPKKNILVIGDIILDHYIKGEVKRISQEAPVPIIKINSEEYGLGGAANVAANISSLSGNSTLLGFIGNDINGNKITQLAMKEGIRFIPSYNEKTIEKTRYYSRNQQILRADKEDTSEKYFDEELISRETERADLIIISDYAKGTITKELMETIKEKKKIIVDPKPKNKYLYNNILLITPNKEEAQEMSSYLDIHEAGKKLKKELSTNVIITRGEEGMSIFNEGIRDIPTYAKEVYDITGAGDTVIATLGLALASGANLEQAAILANHSAGIVVGKVGTATAKISELERTLFEERGKIKTAQELQKVVQDLNKLGKKVAWTSGCFDLLHTGHTKYLKKSKELGDYLIVGLNSDESVKELKGTNRPVISENQRAELISSLECVDYVTIFKEKRAEKVLSIIKPNIYVKGGDYNLNNMDQGEKRIIESYKGEIKFVEFVDGESSTNIIKKVKETQ